MNVVAIIPARGGSKRLHKKNIQPIWGRPMICWAIDACMNSDFNIEPWVSSDSKEILDIAKTYGAKTISRDEELCSDIAPKQSAIRHAASIISKIKTPDLWISLQANSPQIKSYDIDNAIKILDNEKKDEIFSVDSNLMQNAAFRIFKGDYVFQQDLSTNCGVYVCDLIDVHTIEDIHDIENNPPPRTVIWS